MVIFNALQTSFTGGIGRVSYEISKAIYKLNEIDFKIVIREEDKPLFDFAKEEDLIIISKIKNSKDRNYFEQFVLPQMIYKQYKDAIIHYPDSMAPIFAKNKVVITVHDLSFKSVKGAFTWKTTLWKNFITNLSIRKADKIIAITNFTKSEIKKYYPTVNKDKIDVVYNGFNDFSKNEIIYSNIKDEIKALQKKSYILTVSTISPRKNIDGLIKAFNLIKDKTSCNLVVAGKNGWLYESVFKLVEDLNLQERVVFTGGINDDELMYLYKNAEVFVYPSFYEGFGLPPLEAMSFGVPCVVSNTSSIPEVVGDAGMYFDPSLYKNISEAILDLVDNRSKKNNLTINAYNRLGCFSWNKCGVDILLIYKQMLNYSM